MFDGLLVEEGEDFGEGAGDFGFAGLGEAEALAFGGEAESVGVGEGALLDGDVEAAAADGDELAPEGFGGSGSGIRRGARGGLGVGALVAFEFFGEGFEFFLVSGEVGRGREDVGGRGLFTGRGPCT